jgi:hypothetical protein
VKSVTNLALFALTTAPMDPGNPVTAVTKLTLFQFPKNRHIRRNTTAPHASPQSPRQQS